jgi:acetyl esterase/lipase
MRPFLLIAVALFVGGSHLETCLANEHSEPEQILLWPEGAPLASGTEDRDKPRITWHAPAKGSANGCAVIVCPGGGYGGLADTYEGHDVARWFNRFGVTAFVLRYRHAPHYRHPTPLGDIQRAVRLVRNSATRFEIDPERIGVLGFSAGGHLCSTAGTHFDDGNSEAADPIDRVSCRPDFLVLVYPVITFTSPFTHKGSRRNLLGDSPAPELVESLSSEKQVTDRTPPTFLFHTTDDQAVPSENSVLFYLALRRAGVPAEMHVYEPGRHGVGLAAKHPTLSTWPTLLKNWMKHRKLLERREG